MMHRYLFGLGLSLCMNTLIYSDELMSARIQSVVDEVSELRERYERAVEKNSACMEQVNEQQKEMKKISKSEGYDYELFEKNRKRLSVLEAENTELKSRSVNSSDKKKQLESLGKEIDVIKRENTRLNNSAQILVEKNHALLDQLNKIKRSDTDKSNAKQTQGVGQKSQSSSAVNDKEILAVQGALKTAQEKNRTLQDSSRIIEDNLHEKLSQAETEIKSLEEKLVLVNSDLAEANKKNKALSSRLKQKDEVSVKAVKPTLAGECEPKKVITVCKDDNPFPQLMMKKKKEIEPHTVEPQMVIEVNKAPASIVEPERIVTEKGSVYRMNKEADIYDGPNGKSIDLWEEKTSFTSNVSEGEWIKITGHFVDRQWQRSQKEMWVKAKDTIKR